MSIGHAVSPKSLNQMAISMKPPFF